jgi:enterochelin esterase-like enzyme
MKIIVCALVVVSCLHLHAQDSPSFTETLKSLTNTATREATFENLKTTEQVPFAVGDSVLFIYRGEGTDVKWMGDFNGWGHNKTFKNTATQLVGSDIWILKSSFPSDARLDYKIVVDNTQWMLDPLNPHQQWSGVGGGSPNSELRMPAWREDKEAIEKGNIPVGKLFKDVLFSSQSLGYQIMYSVYVPTGYNPSQRYPVLYVTDGYEYLHENMGNIVTTLNNLISEGKIKPLVAVFIDHREPVNRSNNRRMTELAMNEKYLDFFVNELITEVEAKYSVSKKPEERAIIGTSMGGLTAAYFSFSRPDVFGLAGIQSPAFWFRPEIYTMCDNPEKPPVKVFMTTGVINDTEEGARKMKAILDKNTCTYQYKEVNQGHSWGNWRDLLDDILIYFFPVN